MGLFTSKKDIEVIVTPDQLILVPGNNDTPTLSYSLDCDYTLYKENYKEVQEQISKFINTEQSLAKKLEFQAEYFFIHVFKNTAIMKLPSNLEKLESSKYQKPYNAYPRFQNLLAQLNMSIDSKALSTIKGKFFYSIIQEFYRDTYDYKLEDIYKLAYYYEWVYLIPIYQSVNLVIEDNKLNINTK